MSFGHINYNPFPALLALILLAMPLGTAQAANPEARAVWVTRWEYTTETGGSLSSTYKARIKRIMGRAVEGHFNIIVFQVRGQGDAFYSSNYEPWAYELTSRYPSSLGTDPGWDPLQYAIGQAHQRGLELHAWLNTFNCWKGTTPPPAGIDPEHMYNAHPEWLCADHNATPMPLTSDYVSVSPGNPEVTGHIHNVAMDILQRYDVDGIHFDYIRYPHSVYSRDLVTDSLFLEEFGITPDEDIEQWKQWQRDQITNFLQNFYQAAISVKPMVKISAAVIGRYNYPSSGWDCYNTVYQDARLWASRGIVDYLAPMIYWAMNEFAPLIDEWTHYSYGRHILAGIAAYKMSEFGGWSHIEAQIDTARAEDAAGVLLFRSGSLDPSDGYYWSELGADRFRTLATVPPMWWKDNVPPNAPVNVTVTPVQADSIQIEWQEPMPASDGDLPVYYGIYRSTGSSVNVNDPEQLIHITIEPVTEFYDTSADSAASYSYGVVAYDDGDNESTSSGTPVQIADHELLPNSSALLQNYPNPFNAGTSIAFHLSGGSLRTSLQVYNILGQKVITLVDDILEPGDHQATWDGRDERGSPVASGIYLCSLRAGDWQQTKRMMLIR